MVTAEDFSETLAFFTLKQVNDWLETFGLCLTVVVPHNDHGHATRGTAFFLTRAEDAPHCECAECAATGDPLDAEINELVQGE